MGKAKEKPNDTAKEKNTDTKKIHPTELTPETILSMLTDNELVLVDFWAEWCAPCLMQRDELEENGNVLLAKYPQLKICKMNVDTDNGISNNLDIRYIPDIVIVYKKHIGIMQSGFREVDGIQTFIAEFITHADSHPDEVVDFKEILFTPPPKRKPKKTSKKSKKSTDKKEDNKSEDEPKKDSVK